MLLLPLLLFSSEVVPETIKGIEITIRKEVRFHIQQAHFAGIYLSVLFQPGYRPPCKAWSVYHDNRSYCMFAYRNYRKPKVLQKEALRYLKDRQANLSKLSQVHIKIFYQALANKLQDGDKIVSLDPALIELWSEANFFPHRQGKSVGHPEKNMAKELNEVWVRASAGFPYYRTTFPKRGRRAIGSIDTKVFFTLTSQLKHQFLFIERVL